MRLTIVGCAGSYPNATSAASSYLVEHDGFRMLLDLGSGALGPLHDYTDPCDVDAVVLSHLHPDHCLDVCALYVARRYRPGGAARRIPVFGPRGVARRMATAYGTEPEQGMAEVFDFAAFPPEPFVVGPFTVTAVKVRHPVAAYALRVEADERVLVYSGDTGPCAGLVSAAREADVALFEASFRSGDDNPPDLHLTARQAAELAREAGAKRLILTHMVAWHDNSGALAEAAVFDHGRGGVQLAAPGMVVEV